MAEPKDKLDVHVNVAVTGAVLSAIVENAKQIAGREKKGGYRVDTADLVGKMISLFLDRFDFESFVRDKNNYPMI